MYLGLLGLLALQPFFINTTMTIYVDKDRGISIENVNHSPVEKIWIDTLDNVDNMYSTKDSDHSYTITEFDGQEDDDVAINFDRVPGLDKSAFIVTADGDDIGFYFDDNELLYKEVDLLTNYCSTCLDQHQKERIVLFMVKFNLFQYAVENELLEDQIQYYMDLARLVGIDYKYNAKKLKATCNCNRCIKCNNNFCAIC